MADFLLVHGAAHGAWCWRDLAPALTALGHRVTAIDLPGHGNDKTPYTDVTLDRYINAVVAALPEGEKTHVVGHSMGGYPTTGAAQIVPDRIARLIYLCAYVPAPGLSLAQMRMLAPSQPLLPAIRMTQDAKGWTADPAMVPDLFYHDCPADTVTFAMQNLCIQATQPTSVAIEMRGPQPPRSYIRCTNDRTIPPEFQITMTADWPAGDVHSLPTSHSPFFSDPDGLAHLLSQITKG